MNNWVKHVQQLVMPERCMLCDANGLEEITICPDCLKELPFIKTACIKCGIPLPRAEICPRCQNHPPPYSLTYTALLYRRPIRELVLRMKFSDDLMVAELLGELLVQALLRNEAALPDLIIPVPLHKKRLELRGYNQAAEIGKYLSKKLKVDLEQHIVTRNRNTEAQTELKNNSERKKNVSGSFTTKAVLDEKHVVILDDVITTGATVTEVSKTVKLAGAKRIDVWAVARTP